MVWNSLSLCLSLLSAGITGMYLQGQLNCTFNWALLKCSLTMDASVLKSETKLWDQIDCGSQTNIVNSDLQHAPHSPAASRMKMSKSLATHRKEYLQSEMPVEGFERRSRRYIDSTRSSLADCEVSHKPEWRLTQHIAWLLKHLLNHLEPLGTR